MAYTLAQKVAIESAIASGTTRVSYDGKSVEYRSLDEMKRVLTTINDSIAAQLGMPRRVRAFRITTFGDRAL